MDSNEDKFFIKETDFNGVSTISQYAFTKVEDRPESGNNYDHSSKKRANLHLVVQGGVCYERAGSRCDSC